MAHGQWTEVEARGVLNAWRKSGLSIENFARERSLVPQRLYHWRAKIEGKDADAKAAEAKKSLSLLPVSVVDRQDRRGEPVTVLLRSGHMVKVGRDFDEMALARVVAVLDGA